VTDKTIRVKESTADRLRILKDSLSAGTYDTIISDLVDKELKLTHAYTEDGYLPIGAVVLGPANVPLVIKSIQNGKVIFDDNTYLINGSKVCYTLRLLSYNVNDYDGGLMIA